MAQKLYIKKLKMDKEKGFNDKVTCIQIAILCFDLSTYIIIKILFKILICLERILITIKNINLA